jgi:hypothetical protein
VIGKVTRGSDVGGLLRYLYGPGKANEHTDPHLVASWQGDTRAVLDHLEPGHGPIPGRRDVATLAARLALPLQLAPDGVDRHVWQCSMRAADGDRRLTDAEWATIAQDVVERTGFAPAGDPGGCRWVAVRHADDHIHLVVVLARQDGAPAKVFRDWPKVHAAARAAEQRFGLQVVTSPDRSAEVDPSRAEWEKAARSGAKEPPRRWLARHVRVAAAGSASRGEFAAALQDSGVLVTWRKSVRTPGELTGYAVARPGDVDGGGQQIWYSGSKLSPDLSLPKLRARWAEVASTGQRSRLVPRSADDQRVTVLARAAKAVGRAADGPVTDALAVSAAEVAAMLARAAENVDGGPLTDAARGLAAAARRPRGQRPATQTRIHGLRDVATSFGRLGDLLPGETGHALQIVGDLARIARSIAEGEPRPERAAHARRGETQLRRYTGAPTRRDVEHLVAALGTGLASTVTADPAWPALAARLRLIGQDGLDPATVLRQVAGQRELGTAKSAASVLHHRLGDAVSPLGHQLPKATPGIVPSNTRNARPLPPAQAAGTVAGNNHLRTADAPARGPRR